MGQEVTVPVVAHRVEGMNLIGENQLRADSMHAQPGTGQKHQKYAEFQEACMHKSTSCFG
jgi:hypothetical protein